jgi:hypothetical protein
MADVSPLGASASLSLNLEGLAGHYKGVIANPDFGDMPGMPAPAPAYPVELNITSDGEFAPWDVVGTVNYPTLGLFAPIQAFYPMDCIAYMAGEFPVGSCWQMMENFRIEGAVGDPGDFFSFGEFTISLQEDGSLFYAYLNGNAGVTYAYFSPPSTELPPPDNGECVPLYQPDSCDVSLQWSVSQCCNQGPCAPSGLPGQGMCTALGQDTATDDFQQPGVWKGTSVAVAPQLSAAMLPTLANVNITLEFSENSCAFGRDNCGFMTLGLEDGSTVIAGRIPGSVVIHSGLDCSKTYSGDAPTGSCYQFNYNVLHAVGGRNFYDPIYATVSPQTDGTLFWVLQQGMLGTAYASLGRVS